MNASDNLYEIMGVSKSADENEIRKAYKKLCLTNHPDKGGSAEEFQKIQKAYEILSDESKRSMYDQTGMTDENDMAQGGMHGGVDLGSMFANMFGGMQGMGGMFGGMGMPGMGVNRGKRGKPLPKIHEIPVCLNDFYHGKHLKLQFERSKFCSGCKGEGYSSFTSCGSCKGSGVVEQMAMIGPGMFATSRGPCTVCSGNGKMGTKSCDKCKGNKFFKEEKSLDIFIKPGMKAGDKIVFSNECSDDIQFKEPGDVHIIFQEADETIPMTRKGNDLYTSHVISFSESIIGTSYILKNHPKYPNGFTIKIPKGILNNETIIISNEGMPIKGHIKQFGNLHVKIDIKISQKEKTILQEKEDELKSIFTSSD